MKIVLLGASGMLGQALTAEGLQRGHEMVVDRVDVSSLVTLDRHIRKHSPDLIINAAAITDLGACEADRVGCYAVNTAPLWVCDHYKLVHISSDQAANPLNVYARSKKAAEELVGPKNLIIRTNIVGPKNTAWMFEAIESDAPVTLFNDYYTASIDIWSFSDILFGIIEQHPSSAGLLNIASRDTVSKKAFVEALAKRMGKTLTRAVVGSVRDINPERPSQNGLDVTEVEYILNRQMPGLDDVIGALVERRNKQCSDPSRLMVV